MRLLNTTTLELSRLYFPNEVPDYVIFSHRWNTEEVTFADITKDPVSDLQSPVRQKNGFAKIQGVCELASTHGYEWIWIDSCCIDKSSSAELQEAINSMWRYYRQANICYVYLADVPDAEAGWGEKFGKSVWFTRGWTLQELIAPTSVEFYAANWEPIGTKIEREMQISKITSIRSAALRYPHRMKHFTAAQKLSWAAHRKVTREEDQAYSLMGLFDINIPLLYGEGGMKAFHRLQEAIYNSTGDHSIFLARYPTDIFLYTPLLSTSLVPFCEEEGGCSIKGPTVSESSLHPFRYNDTILSALRLKQTHEPIITTSNEWGTQWSTSLPLLRYSHVKYDIQSFESRSEYEKMATHVAVLNCTLRHRPNGAFCLLLRRSNGLDNVDIFCRLNISPVLLPSLKNIKGHTVLSKLLIFKETINDYGYDGALERVEFSFKTNVSFVGKWYPGHLIRPETWLRREDEEGNTQDESLDYSLTLSPGMAWVSYQIPSESNPALLLTVILVREHNTWSILEVLQGQNAMEPKPKPKTLFKSLVPADRCSIETLDGISLSVKLHRLPSSARGGLMRNIRYGLSINQCTK